MNSRFGNALIVAVLAAGVFLCTAYVLTSDHRQQIVQQVVSHS
jgi:hypothetical protein